MTVREWFRRDRAAMWQSPTHPAHGVGRELDALGCAILVMNNPRLDEEYAVTVVGRDGTRERSVVLCLPADMIRIWAEQDCEAALAALLALAWPITDREQYDQTYAMLRRELRAVRRDYFEGLCS